MAAIIQCCSSFSHTSDGRPPPRDKSRGPETGKLAKSIAYSLVRTPGAHHPVVSKFKPLSTKPKEYESKGILQTSFGSLETLDKLSAFKFFYCDGKPLDIDVAGNWEAQITGDGCF